MKVTGSFSKQVCPYTLESLRNCAVRRTFRNCEFSLERCASKRLLAQVHGKFRSENNYGAGYEEERVLLGA